MTEIRTLAAPILNDVLVQTALPLDQHPAAVYLSSLSSERSRRVTAQALRTVAALITGEDPRQADILMLNWGALRYPHTAAIRAKLLQAFSPATANRLLSALRGVLKEAWRLGYMSADDYQRAVDVRFKFGQHVRRHQHAVSFGTQLGHDFVQFPRSLRIEAGGGFVQYHQLG